MSRAHARSTGGRRAYSTIPCGHGTRLTVPGALGTEGIVAAMSIEAATDGAVFDAFLDQVLLPALRPVKPDAVLVRDNLSAHKAGAVRERLDRSECRYRYLPSSSPDLNPMEPAWAKVKGRLREVVVRTAEARHAALGPARDAITPQDAQGFFRVAERRGRVMDVRFQRHLPLAGAEDITIDHAAGRAYISSEDRWKAGKTPQPAGIYGLNLANDRAEPINLTADLPSGFVFHPHGLSLFCGDTDERRLFVINHRGAEDHGVEVFDVDGDRLWYIRTIADR